ncbi:hypothetical protein NEUTE1DRAFT_83163 [Neurospora tetrasperma FGSC 2508]|uniref:Succinate dehydrogenase assembly factor 4, mitochondrial n=1 Tax=Neurospora tetrasperma (strain FGSC 2508 / ATCC MYA-4615 / P0657) TaxID=510951 RepID=F8MNH2_NEUT8|nr:uncharacterized protein NEUTE1DRAFT_83163 [Neurospora tetrasperma FGSC 2508]EGO56147.1 hypothetical protein NEUTE1DRAFT_83163 [Neurospora tetrasperma FGSC 2508]EGZ70999.1 DUF1674-domain-containing protein [Neurospora tetrasperma FGSC 2509]
MSRRLLTLTRPLSGLSSLSSLPKTTTRFSSSFLQRGPAPPRLPADQQAEFERLQAAAEAALYTHVQVPPSTTTSTTPSSPENNSKHVTEPAAIKENNNTVTVAGVEAPVVIEDASQTFSGGIRKGAPPEFEGDKNPKTGEIGGPKNEPLRWGAGGDWSYNGRVTDF